MNSEIKNAKTLRILSLVQECVRKSDVDIDISLETSPVGLGDPISELEIHLKFGMDKFMPESFYHPADFLVYIAGELQKDGQSE